MVEKNRPADIRFDDDAGPAGDSGGPAKLSLAASGSQTEPQFMESIGGGSFDDLETPFDEEEIESVASRRKRKTKPGMPSWILALAVFMLFAIFGGAYLSFTTFKKRSASYGQQNEATEFQAVPQPVIAQVSPSTERPVVAAPTEPVHVAAENPVVSAAEQPPVTAKGSSVLNENTAPLRSRDDAAAASSASDSEIKKLKEQLDRLSLRVGNLEDEKLAARKVAAEIAAKASQPAAAAAAGKPVAKQALPVKPSPAPVVKPKAPPPREEVLPSYRRDFTISAIVNNRAFVIKKMPDGSEQEISVVVGDKIDGKSVEAVDGQSKEVRLEGNQRITTGRVR